MTDQGRRRFIGLLGAGLATPYLLTFHRRLSAAEAGPGPAAARHEGRDVFSLSVASGDPSASGVILWTRIDPAAYQAGEPLRFQVADDPGFGSVVMEGSVAGDAITPARDFTVRVDLDGKLQADRRYYYRYIYRGIASPVGRCRTLPAPGSYPSRLTLGLLSCQDYTNGYYGALRSLARRDEVDFVLHLGDFIYESAADPRFQPLPFADRQLVLPSAAAVALDLADYRHIHRTYRTDADLQHLLERHTLIAVWDDHETANDCYWDYARDTLGAPDHPYTTDPAYGNDPALLRTLRLEAMQAWAEYIPARIDPDPSATHPHEFFHIERRFVFGELAELFMTDGRSFRSAHPCGEGDVGQRYLPVGCRDYEAPERTMLGEAQRRWLTEGLSASGAQWKLWGNQVMLAELSLTDDGRRVPVNVDAWDGYQAERELISRRVRDSGVENLVVVTGDFHSFLASHLKIRYGADLNRLPRNTIGVEFMTTSVTSANGLDGINAALQRQPRQPDLPLPLGNRALQRLNPHIAFFDSSQHGYSLLEITPDHCFWSAYAVDKNDPAASEGRLFRRLRVDAGRSVLQDRPLSGWAAYLAGR